MEVNELGPIQLYTDPGDDEAVRFSELPEHMGALLPNAGVDGVAFTTTRVVLLLRHGPNMAVTVYTPDTVVGAPGNTGF
jgi:hypothetical protein